MGFVDLQRRRQERAGFRRGPESPPRSVAPNPILLVGIGFVLGSAVSYFYSNVLYLPGISALLLAVAMIALLCYFGWPLVRRSSEQTGPRLGSEKQLLMAIRASGGITPVEAALETSLTVDEADGILTRFVERGHLRVESRDGALLYTLPGKRPIPEPRTI